MHRNERKSEMLFFLSFLERSILFYYIASHRESAYNTNIFHLQMKRRRENKRHFIILFVPIFSRCLFYCHLVSQHLRICFVAERSLLRQQLSFSLHSIHSSHSVQPNWGNKPCIQYGRMCRKPSSFSHAFIYIQTMSVFAFSAYPIIAVSNVHLQIQTITAIMKKWKSPNFYDHFPFYLFSLHLLLSYVSALSDFTSIVANMRHKRVSNGLTGLNFVNENKISSKMIWF